MQASVYIDSRYALGTGAVPANMQWVLLDVGAISRLAMLRLPIAESDSQQPELEWCRHELQRLVVELKRCQSVHPAEIELEEGVSVKALIDELERALATPDGISSSFRGRWST